MKAFFLKCLFSILVQWHLRRCTLCFMRSVGVHGSLGSSLLCISCQYSVTTNTPLPPCNKTGLRMDFQSVKWISRAGGSPRAIFPPSTAISARTYHQHHNKCLIQLSEDETCELANQRKISKQHFPLCQQILVKCTYFSERNRQRIFCHCSHCLSFCFVLIV